MRSQHSYYLVLYARAYWWSWACQSHDGFQRNRYTPIIFGSYFENKKNGLSKNFQQWDYIISFGKICRCRLFISCIDFWDTYHVDSNNSYFYNTSNVHAYDHVSSIHQCMLDLRFAQFSSIFDL